MWQAQYLVTFWERAGPRNVVFFNTKLSRSSHGEGLRSGGCEMTILSSIIVGLSSIILGLSSIILGLSSIILGLSSNRLYIGGSTWGTFTWNLPLQDYVAGAVFGEGGVWLYVAGAALRDILGDSRSAKCCIFQYKIVAKIARGRSPKRRVRDDNFIVGYVRIILESSFYWRKQFRDFALKSWTPNFVAGAVFGEVGGWLCLLRALEMTFHVWCGALMRFILCGRHSIWWSWSVTFRGRRSIWWRWSVTFRGRRSISWHFGR